MFQAEGTARAKAARSEKVRGGDKAADVERGLGV